ncbi:RNA-binding protein [Moesziomyces antarcticus]|uniref:Related to PUF4 - member of the PUF protein family n=2 Tax=Pseudozyma antarctica TaxID=84753 RepID=A0A5C3FT38_PSEA2|nr:RNA-binding protein [Moesziomyces antarcticus]GAK65653.1 RNA-binding protein [Moesziomyces antarcticus]SPO46671.1 related to PUF4 - member of the PUF protein family [Moesziomyces antarcticus]
MSANDSNNPATAKLSTPPDADTAPTSSSHSSSDSAAADAADIQARIEQKRHEHEQQRAMQRKVFEHQMALLEKQQREEEQNLLLQRNSNSAATAGAAVASAPTTPPNESAIANPKSSSAAAPTAATAGANTTDAAARANALAHLYRSMPSSRRQSGETQRDTDDIAAAVAAISIRAPAKSDDDNSAAKPNDKAAAAADNLTPVFNERFLFDDELDNEDSAFVKKYNLKGGDDQFPILVQRSDNSGDAQPTAKDANWPKFGTKNADAAATAAGGADAQATAARKSPPPQQHATPTIATSFGTSAGHQQAAFPLPSPSPRLSHTGRDSPAVNASFASVASRQTSGPASPSPGLGGLSGEVGRSGAGSRFVNTAVPAAAFPSFSLGAFSGVTAAAAGAGNESPSRFGAYSPNSFDAAAAAEARRGSRPSSGFFDAFNPTAGANSQGSLFPADKYSMGMVGGDEHAKLGGLGAHGGAAASAKHARKGELDATTQLEELQGDIFALCKDQHGCRFLQKKLEESNPAHRDMIFSETFTHFAELMTDPFGNYLCQKMLEYCTDEQRNLIVELVAPELVTISLNMHGTRAVQKMIDFLSTPRQIHSIIVALSMNVVTLIKDLNGNHVVQKCLNRLGAEDNQFIYNAVAAHCVEVATHRHGCCVLQRCIDHASEAQRVQLVAEITYNALTLVQDPFGNYVVQYVLDLSIARFTDAVVRQFVGNVCLLSVQKFSSNVMEKCIRVSEPGVRKQLIEELLNRARLEKLLRDSYANYVVQTSLDYADPVQRMRLVECIRPILPVIRNTPYGKRIQSKLQRDNLDLGPPNGVPYSVLAAHQQQMHMGGAGGYRGGGGGYMGMNAYPPGPGQGGMPPHMHPHAPQHVYGAPGGSPHMRPPPGGGGHNLPPPHFGQAAYGFNANLPPPMGMQHGASRGAGSGAYNNAGFGNY